MTRKQKKRIKYFQEFCELMQKEVYVYVNEFARDEEMIEEIFQEVFGQVFIHIDELMKVSFEEQHTFVLVYTRSCIYQRMAGGL